MLSWQIIEHGRPLQKVFADTPKPQGSEVLVRITRAGVCHSDVHIWDGYFDLGGGKRFYGEGGCVPPFTLGHEPFGVVEAVGPKAKGVKPGQKRIVYPWIGCGKCAVCKAGQDNYCCVSGIRFLGVSRPGAYSTPAGARSEYLVDAAGIDGAFAATLACSGLTAYSAAAKLPEIGPVARSGARLRRPRPHRRIGAAREGVRHVIACDIDDAKLAAAARLGAKETVNTGEPDAGPKLQGIAAAIFVGSPATAALGIGALRKGGRYVICGLYGGELVHPLPPIAQRAIGIVGSYVGSLEELKEVVALAKRRKIRPAPVQIRPAEEAFRAG